MKVIKLLKYNWNKLYKATNGNCALIISTMKTLVGIKNPSQKEQRVINKMLKARLDGWIENPTMFLQDKGSTDAEKCVFIYLASLRNLSTYLESNVNSIPCFIIEDSFDINLLRNNCLLKIENDKIYFKY